MGRRGDKRIRQGSKHERGTNDGEEIRADFVRSEAGRSRPENPAPMVRVGAVAVVQAGRPSRQETDLLVGIGQAHRVERGRVNARPRPGTAGERSRERGPPSMIVKHEPGGQGQTNDAFDARCAVRREIDRITDRFEAADRRAKAAATAADREAAEAERQGRRVTSGPRARDWPIYCSSCSAMPRNTGPKRFGRRWPRPSAPSWVR